MGATLVAQVFVNWTNVSDRAFRVLVRMALTALDTPTPKHPASIYRAGRELLAQSLRSEGNAETRYRAVKRALAELTEAGAIEHLATGWAGRKAVYRLTLDRSEPAANGGSLRPPNGGSLEPPNGGSILTGMGGRWDPPKEPEEPREELDEEPAGVDPPTTSRPQSPRPGPKPTPNRCPLHGIPLKPRFDGKDPCGFCRREQRGGPPEHDPPPRPPIARVIDLDSRRTA